ncbi:for, partial [Symbiodinium microadriaticum]
FRVSLSSIQLQPAMILAVQLALCGLCGLVQATDEQCLLARPTRADTLEEELEEEEDLHYQGGASSDYMKRWEGKWEKQEPLHRLSHFVALAVRAARDPSRVKLIPTLLSHFWSWGSGDPKEGLVATTLQWTQRNVPSGGVAIDISSRMTAVKTWLEKYLDYEAPFYKIKEARAEAETALRDIKERPKISERALSIANYLLAATSLMVMWREEYNLLETKSVRVNMEGAYEEIRETLKDLVDVFWIYRWGFIRMREDPSDNTYDGFMWFDDFLKVKRKCSVDRKYFSEFQDVVTQVLKREIFVLELAPMLKSFTTLHRLIPGREEEPPESEPFFPEKIYLGPYSGFMMGTEAWMLHQEDVDRILYPSETETSGGSIWKAGGRTGAAVDLLWLLHGDSSETRIGNEHGGVPVGIERLPPYTCGLEIAYHGRIMKGEAVAFMSGIAFMNIKNQSLAIQGYDEERGMYADRMYTGPGLCGLYTLHQFHKYNKPRKDYESLTLGDGILLSFKWEPVTEEDF